MQAGQIDNPILPAPPEPFALIVGEAMRDASREDVEQSLRQMGLRPEKIADGDGAGPHLDAPSFRLRFASLSILAGHASVDMLDLADPRHPSTSQLAASLPGDWRGAGRCWIFVPESVGPDAGAVQPMRMREFFKMMVLLIDLFDASHLFWSPARLWSDAQQFRASVAEMLASGMPPVLHLVAFRRRETGDGAVVRTRGLALFGGQEIEGRMPTDWTVTDMVKRLARLSLDIILNGPVKESQRTRGIEPGEWVSLSLALDDRSERSTLLVEFGRNL